MDIEKICIFCREERHVEKDDKDIYPDEMLEYLASFGPLEEFPRTQDFAGLVQVKAGDDGFLDGETGHLNFFVDFVDGEPFCGIRDWGEGLVEK